MSYTAVRTFRDLIGQKCLGIMPLHAANVNMNGTYNRSWHAATDVGREGVGWYRKMFWMMLGENVLDKNAVWLLFCSVDRTGNNCFDNWAMVPAKRGHPTMTSAFKYLGLTIADVWCDGESALLDTPKITVCEKKWIAQVGTSGQSGFPAEQRPYTFVRIDMGQKVLALSTVNLELYYPESIWDLI